MWNGIRTMDENFFSPIFKGKMGEAGGPRAPFSEEGVTEGMVFESLSPYVVPLCHLCSFRLQEF